MKICGLRIYPEPSYPTSDELREQPELLRRRPERWTKSGAASLLSLAFGALPGCRSSGCSDSIPESPSFFARAPDASVRSDSGREQHRGMASARVFEGGEGRGAVGCIVSAPPVFLTEDEAWEVVNQELSRAGLRLERSGHTIDDVHLPRMLSCDPRAPATQTSALELDGVDHAQGIAFEFLGREDHEQISGTNCTVYSYCFLDAARALAQQLGRADELTVAVFYDPCTNACLGERPCDLYQEEDSSEMIMLRERQAQARSIALLRTQVQQFVTFLRASGTI